MEQTKTPLERILMVLGIFRLEKKNWPQHASELQSFAVELGKPLDFSNYHRFKFIPKSHRELTLDFCLLSKNEWTLGGQAEVKIKETDLGAGHTLPLEVRIQTLAPQKVESKSYCLLDGEPLPNQLSA